MMKLIAYLFNLGVYVVIAHDDEKVYHCRVFIRNKPAWEHYKELKESYKDMPFMRIYFGSRAIFWDK
jgi:hypothetical protein